MIIHLDIGCFDQITSNDQIGASVNKPLRKETVNKHLGSLYLLDDDT
jgi:hypothetical protein